MIKETVKDTILKNGLIDKGEHIVIGLSGGPDSVCLFHILYQMREEYDLTLHAVHINHKIRPVAAEEDQNYVEKLCESLGVACQSFVFDVGRIAKEMGTSSEDAGRRLRYQSFYQVADSVSEETNKTVKIAVAQNRNDQAETLLMRIMRGTGTDGLSGIEYSRLGENGKIIIRPLLDVSRDEIMEYCKENNLNPRIDLTNLEPIYTRNKIRLELLPYIEKNFNENIMAALNRLSMIAKEDKDYFNKKVDTAISEYVKLRGSTGTGQNASAEIRTDVLAKLHPSIRHRLIVKIFEMVGLDKDISAVHLENADRLLADGKTSSATDFPNNYTFAISYEQAVFYKKSEKSEQNIEYEINMNGITEIGELNARLGVKIFKRAEWLEVKQSKQRSDIPPQSCFLDLMKIQQHSCRLVLRSRKQGDYIIPLGMKGKKKIQDFFVDMKVKKESRDRIPLICLGSEVVWVVGSRMSENFKVTDETEHIIMLEYSSQI